MNTCRFCLIQLSGDAFWPRRTLGQGESVVFCSKKCARRFRREEIRREHRERKGEL